MEQEKNEKKKQIKIDGELTIDSALQLIRYDIPCLILGKSSIGKSYTLIKITERWHIPNQLLYIGSEKAENIEGIPKLTDRGRAKDGKDKEIMEYLQPFWFPNALTITASVKNGRAVYERFVKSAWDVESLKAYSPNYMNLHSLLNGLENLEFTVDDLNSQSKMYELEATLIDINWIQMGSDGSATKARVLNPKKLFSLKKDATAVDANDDSYYKDDLADFCAYVRTALGYGNYWLLLDEIDKVLEHDKDKFAPLLHIVRERTLKNFTMIDINEGKGLGIPLGKSFQEGGYSSIIVDINRLLDAGESVLDTRVIAIANKTENIEEALFRRFCQLIANDILIWRKQDQTTDETRISKCLSDIKKAMVVAGEDGGSLTVGEDLIQYIDEVNLQWEYNFLPKMLNKYDAQGNYFTANSQDEYSKGKSFSYNWNDYRAQTAFYNLLENNFQADKYDIAENLYDCLQTDILGLADESSVGRTSQEEAVKGIAGIFAQKEAEMGLKFAAIDIAANLPKYPIETTQQTDKLNLLVLWTEKVLEYLDACIFSNPTTVRPLSIAEFLVPELTRVFFVSIGSDKSILSDNAATCISMWQDFWQNVLDTDSAFSLDCDKELTVEAMYGGTEQDLDSLSDSALNDIQKDTILGSSSELWSKSASGILTNNQMEDSLQSALPELALTLGLDASRQLFADFSGTVEYINDNVQKELKEMLILFKAKAESFRGDPQKSAARRKYSLAAELTKSLLE